MQAGWMGIWIGVGVALTLTASAAGDSVRGAELYQARCGACHDADDNGPGPRHRGVVGCYSGTQPGYDYSGALREARIAWDVETLDQWLKDPGAMVPGNTMMVKLAPEPADRADLIAYLASLSSGARLCMRAPERR